MAAFSVSLRNALKGADTVDLAAGPLGTSLFYLAVPIVIMNLLQTAYNLVDTFWLGQYSKEALAAITFSFPLVFLLIAFGMGLAVAGSVLVAQFEGANNREMAEFAASQTVTFCALAAVVLGAIGYFFIGDILGIMGAAPDVLALATGYMRIISLGVFTIYGFLVFMFLMRGYGDTVTPMLVMFGSVLLNVVLDPALIFGWGPLPALGMDGAAFATVISRGAALLVGLYIMINMDRGVTINLDQLAPDPGFFRKMLGIAVPASIESTGTALSINLMLLIVGGFSTTVVAGYGVGIRILSAIFLPAIATGQAVETMTGQNLGAGNTDRAITAGRYAAGTMFAILTGLGVITFFFAAPIAGIFTTDAAVTAVAADFLRYTALTFGCIGIVHTLAGGFRGAGDTLIAAAIVITLVGLARLPLAYMFGATGGPSGVWLAFTISNIIGAVLAGILFTLYDWHSVETAAQ